jgi:hypothetical protein
MRVDRKKWGSVDPHKPLKESMKPATAITGNLFYTVISNQSCVSKSLAGTLFV